MSRSPKASSPTPEPNPPTEASPAGAPPAEDPEIIEDRAALEEELRATYGGGEAPSGDAGEIPPEYETTVTMDFSPAMCRKVLEKASKYVSKRVGKKWEAEPEELDSIAPALSDVMNEYVAPWLPEFLGKHHKLLALGGVLAFYALPRLLDESEEKEPAGAPGSPAPAAA